MVATVRPREFDADQPSHTEQLANWISRVRSKKIMCRRNRKRNLRVEAVLASVLSKAEHELRSKQMTRILRWQQMKQRLVDDIGRYSAKKQNGGDHYQHGAGEREDSAQGDCFDSDASCNPWDGPLCPELSSLDSFMSQLNEIKSTLQR